MSFIFRRSKGFGPFRFNLSKRGVGVSVGAGPVRLGRSATGRRSLTVRLLKGLSWRKVGR